jgi:hypothetical protein
MSHDTNVAYQCFMDALARCYAETDCSWDELLGTLDQVRAYVATEKAAAEKLGMVGPDGGGRRRRR